ncbi:LysR substrate-binding domain-containing protein [Paraburkholderia xenovorans]|uniref:LysR substrate-binding domain-containing protein n=1 Tax=Paraburkholderia xenovorans TaxID=36873 RepID=UPI0038BCD934
MPVIVEFLRAFPQIRMRVQLVDRLVNLLDERVDPVLRLGQQPSSNLIATRVGLHRQVLCASPAYLKKHGTPLRPEDLLSHDCVTHEGYAVGSNWEFHSRGRTMKIEMPSRLVVSSVEAAVVAATEAAGIARVVSYQIEEPVKSGSLVKLLEALTATGACQPHVRGPRPDSAQAAGIYRFCSAETAGKARPRKCSRSADATLAPAPQGAASAQ